MGWGEEKRGREAYWGRGEEGGLLGRGRESEVFEGQKKEGLLG